MHTHRAGFTHRYAALRVEHLPLAADAGSFQACLASDVSLLPSPAALAGPVCRVPRVFVSFVCACSPAVMALLSLSTAVTKP